MSDFYNSARPTPVPIRPLNVGMVTNLPAVAAPENSFRVVDGYDVTERGLRRHGGWQPAIRSAGASLALPLCFAVDNADPLRRLEERIEDMLYMWVQDGASVSAVVTNRGLYLADPDTGYAPVYWCREYTVQSYSVPVAKGVIVMAGDFRGDLLVIGDWIVRGNGEYCLVEDVTYESGPNTTTITLAGVPATVFTAAETFKILKPFAADAAYYVDFTYGRYKTYLVDGSSPMVFQFDGTWLSPLLITDSGGNRTVFGARTITHYRDRLFFGGTMESVSGALRNQQRLRWTEVLDWSKSAQANYQDLSYRQGIVVKLLGFGELLMAYTTDGVYYGKQTSMPSMPYAFFQLETAGAAPLGMKAVCGFLGGQIFVSADDVYFVGPGPNIERVGTPVAEEMLRSVAVPYATTAKVDAANSRIAIGVGVTSATLTTLWFWNYKSKGWSKSTAVGFSVLTTLSMADNLVFDDVNPAWQIEGSPMSDSAIRSFRRPVAEVTLYGFTTSRHLLYYDRDATQSLLPVAGGDTLYPTFGQLVTQDFEFGLPEQDKTVLALSLRAHDLAAGRGADIRFLVEVSEDAGRRWRRLGVLRLKPGDDEDMVNFRVTASAVRFRLTTGRAESSTATNPESYELVAYALRVRKRGTEVQHDTTRPA